MGACIAKQKKAEEHDVLNFTNLNIQWKDTIPFVAPVKDAICIKVYDGDTITVASKMPWDESPIYRFSVRLNGIDTPEIKCKSESEKRIAVKARDALQEKILGKVVTLRNVTTEKYGRLLADVHYGGTHFNKWMIDKRFAVAYDGGTKKSPDNWEDFHNGK
jgi:micrococcal nuclease